jgi:hypothetical protein
VRTGISDVRGRCLTAPRDNQRVVYQAISAICEVRGMARRGMGRAVGSTFRCCDSALELVYLPGDLKEGLPKAVEDLVENLLLGVSPFSERATVLEHLALSLRALVRSRCQPPMRARLAPVCDAPGARATRPRFVSFPNRATP